MILDKLFQLMSEKHASDIFISAGAPIHIKIQGNTIPVNQQVMLPDMIEKIAYELMSPDQAKTFEATSEMNLSFGRRDMGNFRINIFWQRNSIAIVVRYIAGDIPKLEHLGLPPVLSDVIMEKRGLVLVVGATGSGKSTTIASMLDYRNEHRSGHILTIEDPIEYLFKHKMSIVNQREIGSDTVDWHNALRNAMRQAPDCILIGEIRDRETMQAAIAYAQTGHLCLATLHANNANQAIDRVINFFPEERRSQTLMDLGMNLRAMVSQRLIPKKGGGRVPAIEILINTPLVSDKILKGETSDLKEVMKKSRESGMLTFDESLYQLYKSGQISFEDGYRNADSANEYRLKVKLDSAGAGEDAQNTATADTPQEEVKFKII